MTIIHCPTCSSKITEEELKDGELRKFYCQKCKIKFIATAEIKVEYFIEKKDE